jgi:inorganic pyrophosphatase
MVLTYEPLEVGCIVKVRVIGALIVEDEEGEDAKILSAPVNDARFNGYYNIVDVHPHLIREIQEFFETYKRLEPHKWVKFKEWRDVKESWKIVSYSMEKYNEMMKQR